jgi:hypothetical protein
MAIDNPGRQSDAVFRPAVSGFFPRGTQFAEIPCGCTYTKTIFKLRQALKPTLSM